ncbi:MAG: SpoU rRNA Methylase family, partial [Bacteroidota bacterium]
NADQKTILVIGSESHGISPAVLNALAETFTIPNREGDRSVESLNAGIATAIFLSEMTRNR